MRLRHVFVLGSTLALACGPDATGPLRDRFDVLLVTLDTCRADRLGSYGNARIETPRLDALAAEGTRFENAFTPVPTTLPSHCSIFTGLYPAQHGVHDNGLYELADEAVTLAESLSGAGYATGAVVSAFVLDAQFGLDQGFDLYDDEMDLPYDDREVAEDDAIPEERRRWLVQMTLPFQRRGDVVTERATRWLEKRDADPFFLWVHYFDVHAPYQPPPPWGERYDPDYDGPMDGDPRTFWQVHQASGPRKAARDIEHMVARYDGELSYVDGCLGDLIETLKRLGRWERTLVIVVADHGEGFGEHTQIWEHNAEVFDEVMRVPLVIRHPGGVGAGQVRAGLVRTLDVAPTILDCLGLDAWPDAAGRSLLDLLGDADAPAPGEILLEAKRMDQIYPLGHSFLGLRTEHDKLVLPLGPDDAPGTPLLFDLDADAGETRSLAAERPEPTRRITDRLIEMQRALRRDPTRRAMDELTSEGLRALGYLGDG